MKKMIFLCVSFFVASLTFLPFAHAQSALDMFPQSGNSWLSGNRLSKDAYPLLVSPADSWQSLQNNNFLIRPNNDPGILLPAINSDSDPGIFFAPKFKNCDPGIVWNPPQLQVQNPILTFRTYTPPSLFKGQFVTPFLLPGASLLKKEEELQNAEQLFMLEKEYRGNTLIPNSNDWHTLH